MSDAHPNPPPQSIFAGRLEYVRESQAGGVDLKTFWRRLKDTADDLGIWCPSYESVRTYHYDRDPPVGYIRLVCQAFPNMRTEWLINPADEGPPTYSELDRERWPEAELNPTVKERSAVIEEVLGPRVMPFSGQAVMRAWDRVRAQPSRDIQSSGPDGFRLFVRMVAAPVRELEDGREPIGFTELENYLVEAAPVVGRLLSDYARERWIGGLARSEEENDA